VIAVADLEGVPWTPG